MRMHRGRFAGHWQEIASGFLKLGVTPYGGPAVTGIRQAERQEKRPWVPIERFRGVPFVRQHVAWGRSHTTGHLLGACARRVVGRCAGVPVVRAARVCH
jgi:hypothetical protein